MPDPEAIKLAQQAATALGALSTVLDRVATGRGTVETLRPSLQEAQQSLKQARDALAALQTRLAAPAPPIAGAVRADDLATQLRSVMDRVQSDAVASTQPVATTLRSFDIELKGLVTVHEGTAYVVTPTLEHPVDGSQLSTLKLSFGSVPTLRSTGQ